MQSWLFDLIVVGLRYIACANFLIRILEHKQSGLYIWKKDEQFTFP